MIEAGCKQKGYTIVEIMIVISLIVALLMILVPSFRGIHQEAQMDDARWKLEVLKSAVESYYRHHLDIPQPHPKNITYALQNTVPVIVKEVLKDPFETETNIRPSTFGYEQTGPNNKYYVVWSSGLDQNKQWSWYPAGAPTEVSLWVGSDDLVVSNLPVKKY